MQFTVTSATEEKLVEQALTATKNVKGRQRSEEPAVEPSSDVSMAVSTNTGHVGPVPTDPQSGRTPDLKSTAPLPLPSHLAPEAPSMQRRSRSRPTSRDTSPYARSRPSTPNHASSQSSSITVAPRRSQRTLAKAPDRPLGPLHLEAALSIAIRNLESDIYAWWCANYKPGNPLPTSAYLKAHSRKIRKAAEAVDEADRLLDAAICGKPKKPRTLKKSQMKPPDTSGVVTPDIAFGHLELNSQGSSPL